MLIAPNEMGAKEFDAGQAYISKRMPVNNILAKLRGIGCISSFYTHTRNILKSNPNLLLHCGHIYTAIVSNRLKYEYGTKYLVWVYATEIMDKLMSPQIKKALLSADMIITISEFTRNYIENLGISPERIHKIRPGTDPDKFRPGLDAHSITSSLGIEGKRVLLTIGRFSRREGHKGQDIVICALPKVLKKIPNLVYIIAGSGNDTEYLYQLAKKHGVLEYVKVLKNVDQQDLPALYNSCDVFIMCSREKRGLRRITAEGFGIVFLEASSTGKPVIGGNSGGVPEAVKSGITGILVNPIDQEAIADTIIQLINDPTLAKRLGDSGRIWVENEMNWDRASMEFQDLYRRYFSCDVR
jgi:phosphatidylinositol alpha-1,6-mannosyltransferase